MGKPTGFLEIDRRNRGYGSPALRSHNWHEFLEPLPEAELAQQAARCMDCGIPYCHSGCPVDNVIPDWNHLVYRDEWQAALQALHATNNFPEFTGRICPAPCEASCTLNLRDSPVTIQAIECAIVDRGWQEGWIRPLPPARLTGRRVAIVGSGPAGLACAQQLARAGHAVTVFEKQDRLGGLLRYGIPDFKLEKAQLDRRIAQMRAEGVVFRTGVQVGATLPAEALLQAYDAVVLCGGAEHPRDLDVPGRDLDGIHFAMDFLVQQNRRGAGDNEGTAAPGGTISAKGRHVVVIGGGDTGADCVGTSIRQGAASVTQIEILPRPPERENKPLTWPNWPNRLRTSPSHEEGCVRDWGVQTKAAIGSGGHVTALDCVRMEWLAGAAGRAEPREVAGSGLRLRADLVLLAMGFLGPVRQGLLDGAGLALDARGNVLASVANYRSSLAKVFAAGDMRRGQSLVVWAIREGRQCARAVDAFLTES
jgi:glutamate synthase (NADPH/NADH) small chain